MYLCLDEVPCRGHLLQRDDAGVRLQPGSRPHLGRLLAQLRLEPIRQVVLFPLGQGLVVLLVCRLLLLVLRRR